jgi:type VI secretion system protein ImpA
MGCLVPPPHPFPTRFSPPLDPESILQPVSEASPTGEDLRTAMADTTFSELDELAKSVSADEDVTGGDGKEADWVGAERLATEALGRSKDLQLAAWVTLARVHQNGFEALIEGLDLMTRLLETYWDRLYPGPDEDDGSLDLEYRGMPIGWLDQRLAASGGRIGALEAVPFVPRQGDRWLNWLDRRRAGEVDKYATESPDRYQEMLEAGQVSTEGWTAAVQSADPQALREAAQLAASSEEAVNRFNTRCRELFGESDAPGLFLTSPVIGDIHAYLAGVIPAEDGAAESAEAMGEEVAAGGEPTASGAQSRAGAVAKLQEAADYFRRTEPHSPISYLIQRAVRWANMPFDQLMRDYIKDEATLGQVWEVLGLGEGGSDSGGYGDEGGGES